MVSALCRARAAGVGAGRQGGCVLGEGAPRRRAQRVAAMSTSAANRSTDKRGFTIVVAQLVEHCAQHHACTCGELPATGCTPCVPPQSDSTPGLWPGGSCSGRQDGFC